MLANGKVRLLFFSNWNHDSLVSSVTISNLNFSNNQVGRIHGKKLGDICFKFFLFVPRPPKNDLKMAEKQQNFERKFKFRSIKSYFFKMYGWI